MKREEIPAQDLILTTLHREHLRALVREEMMLSLEVFHGENSKESAPTPKYHTTREAAARLRCTPKHVSHLHASGKLKGFKQGNRLLFLTEDLDAYVMQGATRTVAEIADAAMSNQKESR